MKKKLLFVINQFYKGGAETSLLNLFNALEPSKYEIDFLIMNQCPVKDAVSLVDSVPPYVNLCDAYKSYGYLSIISRIKGRFLYTTEQKCAYYLPALDFVHNKKYDWAFHVGEWWNPSFVAKQVTANHKAAWIHNDLSKAEYFNDVEFFLFFEAFEKFIFVSETSKRTSLEKYAFLNEKSVCIYNINDVQFIRKQSQKKVENWELNKNKPIVATFANIRQQKNHMRQVKVMAELKKRGLDFLWLNFGALTDTDMCTKILQESESMGLREDFLLMGATDNPYKYMALVDVVAVLSDYESWSMVITEAKAVGTPIIATPTSGACEQIQNKVNGMLSNSFSVDSIADAMEELLCDKSLQHSIRSNIEGFNNTNDILESFKRLVDDRCASDSEQPQKDLLYIIDDVNYVGGAHVATKLQINELLKEGRKISIFSSSVPHPHIRNELVGVKFLSWSDLREDVLFNYNLFSCLFSNNLTKSEKKYRLRLTYEARIRHNTQIFDQFVFPKLKELFSGYDVVCVMSEGSVFKKIVATCNSRKKVQWIHIDYCDWMNKNDWTKKIAADDSETFKSYDNIVVLTENIKDGFCKLYPHLKDKVTVNANLMPVEKIKEKALEAEELKNLLHFVTVGRVDYQKAYHRLFEILLSLYHEGYRFLWTIVGTGDEYTQISSLVYNSPLRKYVKLVGNQDNPFTYINEADVFALMSDFEGLPNTIYEAFIVGKPVLATNTGGVKYQVISGETGWLVENTYEDICKGIKYVLDHPEEIKVIAEKLKSYCYNNEKILVKARKVLSLN